MKKAAQTAAYQLLEVADYCGLLDHRKELESPCDDGSHSS